MPRARRLRCGTVRGDTALPALPGARILKEGEKGREGGGILLLVLREKQRSRVKKKGAFYVVSVSFFLSFFLPFFSFFLGVVYERKVIRDIKNT